MRAAVIIVSLHNNRSPNSDSEKEKEFRTGMQKGRGDGEGKGRIESDGRRESSEGEDKCHPPVTYFFQ